MEHTPKGETSCKPHEQPRVEKQEPKHESTGVAAKDRDDNRLGNDPKCSKKKVEKLTVAPTSAHKKDQMEQKVRDLL